MRTTSPILASLVSSCALKRDDLRTTFPYTRCATRVSLTTTIVLFILSETTRPCLIRRRFRRSGCSMFSFRQLLGFAQTLLADERLNARVRATDFADLAEVRKMPRAQLEPEVEELLFR